LLIILSRDTASWLPMSLSRQPGIFGDKQAYQRI
jgi:hypothetical protein